MFYTYSSLFLRACIPKRSVYCFQSNRLECAVKFHSRLYYICVSAFEKSCGVSLSKFPRLSAPQSRTIMDESQSEARKKEIEARKAELKKRLTPLEYHVTQEKGTERAFTGKYNRTSDAGIYSCIVCDEPLFSSENKFESGCGWPAFNEVLAEGIVKLLKDTSHGMVRTEVQCSHCGSHLGHVFDDGPLPKRKRFCINSASLVFHPLGEEPTKK